MIVSRPQSPAQPEQPRYPVTELQLFPRLTRASYVEMFGEQAPPWDRTRPIQRWFDTSVLDGLGGDPADRIVSYEVLDPANGGFRRMQTTAAEASVPNLPGAYAYSKHVTAPTRAVLRSAIDGSESPLNPAYLSEYGEALRIAHELGVDESKVRETEFGGPWRIVWNGENRRLWTVEWNGDRLQVSMLLSQRYRQGIGAPGHWDLSGAEPVWVCEAAGDTGERDPRPETPIPMRRLLLGERLEQTLGGIWIVVRQDTAPPSNEELLARIDRRTAMLAEHFQIAA